MRMPFIHYWWRKRNESKYTRLYFLWDLLNVLLFVAVLLFAWYIWEKKSLAKQPRPTLEAQKKDIKIEYTEANILQFPSTDAPEEVRRQHFEAVRKLAKEVEVIEIKDCKSNPTTIKIFDAKKPLRIHNLDSVSHTLQFGPEEKYEFPAQKETKVSPKFDHGFGTYGFACDDKGAAGIVLVADPLIERVK